MGSFTRFMIVVGVVALVVFCGVQAVEAEEDNNENYTLANQDSWAKTLIATGQGNKRIRVEGWLIFTLRSKGGQPVIMRTAAVKTKDYRRQVKFRRRIDDFLASLPSSRELSMAELNNLKPVQHGRLGFSF